MPVYPDDSFIKELLFSMGDVDMYRDFYPFEEDQSQKCPTIRSFILQFLLEYKYKFLLVPARESSIVCYVFFTHDSQHMHNKEACYS